MEFWGLELKPGQTVKVEPEPEHFLHLSQGALGESKKDDKATMFVKIDGKKLAIGTLSTDKFPQIQFDLVFEKDFELSHSSKSSSVFFSGYKVFQPAEGDEMDFDSEGSEESEEDEEEAVIPVTKENGKAEGKQKQVKIDAGSSKAKPVLKAVGNKKGGDESSDDDESDESDDDIADLSDDDSGSEDGTSEESDEEEEEEETPKKSTGKKRAAETVLKTPASDKKAKAATPSGQKTGDKKGAVHVATPHPAKKASKTPATSDKSPKSGGSVACKSCSKTFNSETALQSHSKAKHNEAK